MNTPYKELLSCYGKSEGYCRIWRFVESVDNGAPPSDEDMKNLAESFREIMEGKDPKKALGISGKKGNTPYTGKQVDERHIIPAIKVEQLRREKNYTRAEALKEVSKGPPAISYESLDGWHKKYRKIAVAFLNEEARVLKDLQYALNIFDKSRGNK